MKFHYSNLKNRIKLLIQDIIDFLYLLLSLLMILSAALIASPIRLVQMQKLPSASLKDHIKFTFTNFFKFLFVILSLLIIIVTILVFIPARLISFGFMKRISNCLLTLQDFILEYFVSKLIFMIYCDAIYF